MAPLEVVVCYAEEDKEAAQRLERHCATLQRSGLIRLWHRGMAEEEPEAENGKHIRAAPIILLLVSPDLEFNRGQDITVALQQRERKARVIPVLWGPTQLVDTQYQHLKLLPDDQRPIKTRRSADQDSAWVEVVEGIRKVATALQKEPPPPSPATPKAPPLPSQQPDGLMVILFLAADSSSEAQLQLPLEVQDIDTRLRMGARRDRFQLKQAWATSAQDLIQTLMDPPVPNIVHFAGDGNEQGLLLQGTPVQGKALADLFGLLSQLGVRCVVLNACYSAAQAQVMAQQVDVVIGMTGQASAETRRAFASGFYTALAAGTDMQMAFNIGCAQVGITNAGDASCFKLHLRKS